MEDEWQYTLKNYSKGEYIEGKVLEHRTFGIFVKLERMNTVRGLIRIVDFADFADFENGSFDLPVKYPSVGEIIKGVILGFTDHNKQVIISLKKSDISRYDLDLKQVTLYGSWFDNEE